MSDTATAIGLPRLNAPASDFSAKTTHGDVRLAYYRGKRLVLFSHPSDFTPVCTTEFIGFAEVLAVNILAALSGKPPVADYDGYGSCPLTVEAGKIVLAEFGYGGKLLPSFPHWLIDGTRPSRLSWLLKDTILPPVYWHGMLKGREWMVKPHLIGTE